MARARPKGGPFNRKDPSRPTSRGQRPSNDNGQELRQRNDKKQTFRIKLKKIHQSKTVEKGLIFEACFSTLNAPLLKLHPTKDGFYGVSEKPEYIDRLTSSKAIDTFKKINIEPVIPPELRAQRSVFVRRLDSYVGEHSAEDLKKELERNQEWLKCEVIKIKHYTHLIKIICKDTEMATKVINSGLSCFHTRIAADQCEREEYTHVLVCYKCYKMNSHPTHQCTETRTLCSECGEEGHFFRDCKNTIKKCLNCDGNHRTLAAACPYKKRITEKKKEEDAAKKRQQETATYSEIAKQAVKEVGPQPKTKINLKNDAHMKMVALILEAHIASLGGAGKFNHLLQDSLKLNFNIDAKFPDRDSQKIFNIYMGNQCSSESEDSDSDTEITSSSEDDEEEMEEDELPDIPSLPTSPQPGPSRGTTPPPPIKKRGREEEDDKKKEEKKPRSEQQETPSTEPAPEPKRPLRAKFTFVRSARDMPVPPPHQLTSDWIIKEHKRQHLGLKMIYFDTDPPTLIRKIEQGELRIRKENIHTIRDEVFNSLPRLKILDYTDNTIKKWKEDARSK